MPNTPTRHPDPRLAEALALHQAGRLQETQARYSSGLCMTEWGSMVAPQPSAGTSA